MKFAEFRRLCLAMPEAEERETWGEATFRVRDRIFAMGSSDGGFVSVKASLDDQAGLVALDPKTFEVAAYTGRFGWVRVRLAGLRPDLAARVVTNAWTRTASRRLVSAYQNEPAAGSDLAATASPRARPAPRRARG